MAPTVRSLTQEGRQQFHLLPSAPQQRLVIGREDIRASHDGTLPKVQASCRSMSCTFCCRLTAMGSSLTFKVV